MEKYYKKKAEKEALEQLTIVGAKTELEKS